MIWEDIDGNGVIDDNDRVIIGDPNPKFIGGMSNTFSYKGVSLNIMMQWSYVYVAQVAMGADQAQTLKALREAESYDGPSIVICYCPCLEQHIKAGMGTSQDEMKKAVECGYWHLYRYDPRRIAEGKNPFQLDSKEPDTSKVMDFLMGENRFASLKNNFPDKADALYAKEVEDVKARYAKYKKLAED